MQQQFLRNSIAVKSRWGYFCLLRHIALSMLNFKPFQRPCKNSLWAKKLHTKVSQYWRCALNAVWEVWWWIQPGQFACTQARSALSSPQVTVLRPWKKNAGPASPAGSLWGRTPRLPLAFKFLPTAGKQVRVSAGDQSDREGNTRPVPDIILEHLQFSCSHFHWGWVLHC